jgi:IS5 family transposase
MHAPEVQCIGKGKAKQPYEFGVKTIIAVTHRGGLVVGARPFPGNPYDGRILSAQLEQTTILLEHVGKQPKQVFVDLGYRGVDADNPGVEIIHRGKTKSLTQEQRRWLKRRQAIEPVIGHLKADHRMDRCWLKGAVGDAINAVLSAVGYNLRCLLRAVAAGTSRRFVSPRFCGSGSAQSDGLPMPLARLGGATLRTVAGTWVTGLDLCGWMWREEYCRADHREFQWKVPQ